MYLEEYKRWLAADLEDADLNPELARIEGNDEDPYARRSPTGMQCGFSRCAC